MNQNFGNDTVSRDDAREIDLLVDGELDDVRRRELLLRLEREPNGWRRCALAFLESQSWRRQLKSSNNHHKDDSQAELPVATSRDDITIHRKTSRIWHGRNGALLAVAASFLAAFTLGVVLDDLRIRNQSASRMGSGDAQSPQARVDKVGPATALANQTPLEPDSVSLVVQGEEPGDTRRIQLPLRDASQLSDGWLRSQPPSITPEMRRWLEQSGHRVRQQRRLWPFELEDGRQVIVPVDQVELEREDFAHYQ